MARPLRIEFPGACYHVCNRGEDGDRIFPSAKYNQAFLEGVADAASRLNVEVIAYCLLKNEYHLLVATPEGNLSRFMRQVDGMYTQNYQNLSGYGGSVFKTRYKSVLLQIDKYLLPVSRYVHNLPKQARTNPVGYAWSSLGIYLNKQKAPAWLNTRTLLDLLPAGPRPAARYAGYINDGVDKQTAHFYGKKNLLSVMGDKKFSQRARTLQASGGVRGKSRGPQAKLRPSIRKVVGEVAAFYKVTEKSIYQAARGPGSKNLPRWVAMYLCQEVGGVTLQEIAVKFGLKRYGTVSTTIGKLKQEFADTPKCLGQVRKLRDKLSA